MSDETERVIVHICKACLDGAPEPDDECHTPGCLFCFLESPRAIRDLTEPAPPEAHAEAGETLHFVALLEKWKDDPDFLREVEQLAKEWPTARAFPPADPPHGYVRVKGPDGVGTGIVPREAIDQGSKVADPTPAQLEALEKWQEANPGATVFPRNDDDALPPPGARTPPQKPERWVCHGCGAASRVVGMLCVLLREWTEEYRTSDDNYEPPEPDMNADGPAERDHRMDEARRMK